jgi:hypothetical protein
MPTGRREVPEPPAAQALARQPGKASTPDPHITTKSLRESPSVRNLSLDKLAVCEGVARSLVQAGHGVMTAKGFFRAGVGLPRASASFPWLSRASGEVARSREAPWRDGEFAGRGGWGTWIRTKTNRVRVCCATVTPFPTEALDLSVFFSKVFQSRPGVFQIPPSAAVI